MSEPKLIAPLLENYVMGDPISDHHGVRCCPAMRKDSDEKYIVKIISVPASQVQLAALILTGAYKTREDALAYFQELSEATVQEAELLQRLSKLEGFSSYEGWQIVPMEDEDLGFDVYLLGPYRQTLERYFQRNAMTHLGAVNLGLDMCAALSVCRRLGYLYVDLKPSNIFITANQEYRIGDLGFVRLDSLKYASLAEKYLSQYTAPEITDAYSALNATLDIYAAGLILYQAYNNGVLPAAGEPIAPPAYADYEMAEIILKACAENPEDRWQDPVEMGQALIGYMQRNGANDTPIIPVPVPEEPEVEESAEVAEESEPMAVAEEYPEQTETEDAPSAEESTDEEVLPEEAAAEEEPQEVSPVAEVAAEDEPEVPNPNDEQFVIDGFLADETIPTEESAADLPDAALSDDTSEMLAQADELIAHEPPAPVVAPEAIDVPIPPSILPEPEEAQQIEEVDESVPESTEAETEPEEEALSSAVAVANMEDPPQEAVEIEAPAPKKRRKLGGLIAALISILVVLLLVVGGIFFYKNYYLQPILNITLTGEGNSLTVLLDTKADNDLLTVYCTDTYGNTLKQPVTDNTAQFTQLQPGSTYTVSVRIEGFHKLIGTTSKSYSTTAETNIISFTAVTGDTDGSVNLHFSVQGPDNTKWFVKYSAPGKDEKTVQCSGHMASITDLEVGSVYTFRLEAEADLYVVGNVTLQHTASKVISPENLSIQGFDAGSMIVTWQAPEGTQVNSWTVRCYNNDGYDKTFNVTGTSIAIAGLDPSGAYTVDVKAEGMSVSKWASVSANSVTFKDILLDDSTPGQLVITWNYEGTAPEDGWMLFYTVDGSDKQVVHCDKNTCTISPIVPGAHYTISFELPENITVFGGTAEYDAPDNGSFNAYGVTADNFTFRMCWTSRIVNWKWYNLMEREFSNTYKPEDKASFVVLVNRAIGNSNDQISTLFVVKDANGKLVSVNEGRTRSWNAMWTSYNGRTGTELDLPAMPQIAGNYTVDIYFSGRYVATYPFTVS